MKIILGSSSPFRRKILEEAGISFEVVTPDIDEKKIRALDNLHVPVILSYAKSQAVAQKVTEPAIIIACDQIAICKGIILEKPENADEVRAWYKIYADSTVQYVNGITVYNTETGMCLTAQETSTVRFKTIPESFTEQQIDKGIVFSCNGGLCSETEEAYSTIIRGSKQSTIGLPLQFVLEMIEDVR
jgi:septum formation protein